MTTQNAQGGAFPPPPNYPRPGFGIQQRTVRPTAAAAQYAITGGAAAAAAAAAATLPTSQQQLLQQQRKQLIQHQEQQKRRLLQQQQNQHLLIPSNANAAAVEISPGIQNIDSLLNNTVAPNVSLQRSSSVPESQLSPNFGGGQQSRQPQQQQQQPYSPLSQQASAAPGSFPQTATTVGGGYQQQGGARLSPHPPPFTQQLSPRQAYPQATNQSAVSWSQAQTRLSVQQQQNPMLNAQLTVGIRYYDELYLTQNLN